MKEARHKKACVMWFHPYEMSQMDTPVETGRLVAVGRREGKAGSGRPMNAKFPFGVLQMWNSVEMVIPRGECP